MQLAGSNNFQAVQVQLPDLDMELAFLYQYIWDGWAQCTGLARRISSECCTPAQYFGGLRDGVVLYSSAWSLHQQCCTPLLRVCISSFELLCAILGYAWSMHQQCCTPPLRATFVGGHSTAESSTTGVTISWAFFAHNQIYPSDITIGNSNKC